MKIEAIELKFTMDDGTTVQGLLGRDDNQRWGNDREHLAECVDPMELFHQVMLDLDAWADDQ